MAAVRIRPAKANDDFDAIRQVYYQTWLTTYRNQLPSSILSQLTPATWQPEQRWQNMLLALNTAGEVVGVCSYGPARLPLLTGFGELYSIYVLPAYQHQGIGQQLMSMALAKLAEKYRHLYLEVLITNQSAQRFYRKNGFHQTKLTRSNHVPGGKLQTVIFAK